MGRGLPFSVAVHVLVLLAVFYLGNRVTQKPARPPHFIAVKIATELPRLTQAEAEPVQQEIPDTPPPPKDDPVIPPKQVPEKPAEKPKEKPKPEIKEPEPPKQAVKQPEPEPRSELVDEPSTEPGEPIVSGPSVLGTDTDFPFAWYLTRVKGQIARSWNPRQLGFRKSARVLCVVHFRIARNGSVSQVTLTQSSGESVFDREALRVIQTTKLPPLPPDYTSRSVGLSVRFNLESQF